MKKEDHRQTGGVICGDSTKMKTQQGLYFKIIKISG